MGTIGGATGAIGGAIGVTGGDGDSHPTSSVDAPALCCFVAHNAPVAVSCEVPLEVTVLALLKSLRLIFKKFETGPAEFTSFTVHAELAWIVVFVRETKVAPLSSLSQGSLGEGGSQVSADIPAVSIVIATVEELPNWRESAEKCSIVDTPHLPVGSPICSSLHAATTAPFTIVAPAEMTSASLWKIALPSMIKSPSISNV